MDRLRLLAASLAHTPPRRLLARLRLRAKQSALESVARVVPLAGRLRGGSARLRDDAPRSVFPERAQLIVDGASPATARFLGLEAGVEPPIDWTRGAWRESAPLALLTLHFMEWLEGLDDGALARCIEDWIERVRPYGPGYARAGWNSYALSIRCVVWMQQLAARRSRLAPAFIARAVRSIEEQLQFLTRNLETDLRGNHLLRNVRALLWGARALDGDGASRWRRIAEKLLIEELGAQVLADGLHCERSPAYHAQVLGDLVDCAHVLPPGDTRERVLRSIDLMARAQADLTHPDGGVSLFGDGGLHLSRTPAQVLDGIARLRGDVPRARPVAPLDASGFFAVRDGTDYLLVKCGRLGDDALPAHAHGDALAFEWTPGGRRVVVDAGTFEYRAGPLREQARSTRAHNTVTVAGADQAEFYGAFRVGRRPEVALESYEPRGVGFVLTGSHDGFARLPGSPIHRRRFEATASRIAVADGVTGGRGQPVEARLLLHPDVTIAREPGGAVLTTGPIRARFETASPFTIERASWWPDLGVAHETSRIVIAYGAAPASGAFVLERIG